MGHPASCDDERVRIYDCGIVSLYHMLTMSGINVDMIDLERSLPDPRSDGYSLQELIDCAKANRFSLMGIQLPGTDLAPQKQAIVFMDRKTHGHYIVIRPVGRSNRLVQVLDADGQPTIVDYEILRNKPDWTGIALVEKKVNVYYAISVTLLSMAVFYYLYVHAKRWFFNRGR